MLWFLIRLVFLVILFFLIKRLWLSLSGAVKSEGGLPPRDHEPLHPLVRDPECGLHFPQNDALTARTEQGLFYFCSRECRDAYLNKQKKIE